MSIEQELSDRLKAAVRARDLDTANIIRMINTRITERKTAKNFSGEVDDKLRLEVIAADLGRPGLVVRIDPNFKGRPCFKKVQLSNGETALSCTKHFGPLVKRVAADVEHWLREPCRERITRIFHPVHA